MKIKWLGHAAFAITAEDGTSIVTDPYRPNAFDGAIGYAPITESFDGATVSHKHADHDGVSTLTGSPRVVDRVGSDRVKSVSIQGLPSYHDEARGAKRGENIIFCYDVDDVRVCHMGDLGHLPDEVTFKALSDVDVLLIPVGGTFTIDADQAWQIVKRIAPKVVIPMHFKTPKVGFALDGVETFTAGRENVSRPNSPEIELKKNNLPTDTAIVVLDHAK